MTVTILYCVACGYRGKAERLATKIRNALGVDVTITPGRLSQFDVLADGDLVASRAGGLWNHLTRGGFPNEDAVVAMLTARRASA